jgi:hypothetical protein
MESLNLTTNHMIIFIRIYIYYILINIFNLFFLIFKYFIYNYIISYLFISYI